MPLIGSNSTFLHILNTNPDGLREILWNWTYALEDPSTPEEERERICLQVATIACGLREVLQNVQERMGDLERAGHGRGGCN
ncbi:hypothetical protein L873DRAFT_1805276 [Choiromyces venosus 120613-1]|uniref:Prion-inhibition and propagation HeLo domain-containing protein n=1 Tax=Choiromyces venosus 120613-1 TaxID=1336337 RepID=A0A3N4JW94_9PEZI|nr:hypothetical protein L873DRAFT_1805276 [Choiromyces venosus 120613-1]